MSREHETECWEPVDGAQCARKARSWPWYERGTPLRRCRGCERAELCDQLTHTLYAVVDHRQGAKRSPPARARWLLADAARADRQAAFIRECIAELEALSPESAPDSEGMS